MKKTKKKPKKVANKPESNENWEVLSKEDQEKFIESGMSIPKKKKAKKPLNTLSKMEILERIKDGAGNPEVPKVIGERRIYERKIHGVVWDPTDDASRKRMCTTITAMFLAQMNEPEVAAAMGVRLDVLRSWIKRIPEIRQAKEDGITNTRIALMNTAIKVSMGYNYTEESATKQGPQKVQKYKPPEVKMLTLLLTNMFRGKITQTPEIQTNNQFNITLSKADQRL